MDGLRAGVVFCEDSATIGGAALTGLVAGLLVASVVVLGEG